MKLFPEYTETILIDIDDTIQNLKCCWISVYNKKYNDNLNCEDIVDWDLSKFVKPEASTDIYELLKTPGLFKDMVTPMENSVEVIEELYKHYNIYFVTSCTYPENYVEKVEFMKTYFPFIPSTNIIACKDKFLVKGNYLIDDYVKNFDNFDGRKILMTQSHNKFVKISSDIMRVNNWVEILNYFEKEYNERLDFLSRYNYKFDCSKLIKKVI